MTDSHLSRALGLVLSLTPGTAEHTAAASAHSALLDHLAARADVDTLQAVKGAAREVARNKRPNGVVLWEGPSALDGKPCVAIATGIKRASRNAKTGPMIQVWIMRSDIDPVKASQTGDDRSVCGDCRHRHYKKGACYVTVFQAPLSVYKAYKRGSYPVATPRSIAMLFEGKRIRFGAYGDPAAVPFQVFAAMRAVCGAYTAYTHQWMREDMNWAMASTDTAEETAQAQALGLRVFRAVLPSEPIGEPERDLRECLSDSHGLSCIACRLCDGVTAGKDRPSIFINAHGARV